MLEGVTVINIMADGTICDDLSTYIGEEHQLPEDTARMIIEFMREGRRILMEGGD